MNDTSTGVETDRPRHLRVIILDDVAWDAELIQRQLRSLPFSWSVSYCADERGYREALAGPAPDMILSDFKFPGFSGTQALAVAREHHPDVPFILVSGAIGEEALAGLLREGATDYVAKNNLSLLDLVVARALRHHQMRLDGRRAIEAVREAIVVLHDTKRSFKSKTLGQLREKLERLLETPLWH